MEVQELIAERKALELRFSNYVTDHLRDFHERTGVCPVSLEFKTAELRQSGSKTTINFIVFDVSIGLDLER